MCVCIFMHVSRRCATTDLPLLPSILLTQQDSDSVSTGQREEVQALFPIGLSRTGLKGGLGLVSQVFPFSESLALAESSCPRY